MTALFRLNHDNTVAIDTQVCYYPMASCPTNVKVQLHTKGGIAIYGTVTNNEVGAKLYQGWRPIPAGVKNVE